jgi:hypothetical protein
MYEMDRDTPSFRHARLHEAMCPYLNAHSKFCSASVMRVRIDVRMSNSYCATEDHDRCAIFLAKALRG